MNEAKRFSTTVGRDVITVETGKLAGQANGAVTVRLGDTLILTTATMARIPREGIDFFPLSGEYEERLYAAGRIPGSFFRREGRPSESAILVCRLTDRPLRPLLPEDLRNDEHGVVGRYGTSTLYPGDQWRIGGLDDQRHSLSRTHRGCARRLHRWAIRR